MRGLILCPYAFSGYVYDRRVKPLPWLLVSWNTFRVIPAFRPLSDWNLPPVVEQPVGSLIPYRSGTTRARCRQSFISAIDADVNSSLLRRSPNRKARNFRGNVIHHPCSRPTFDRRQREVSVTTLLLLRACLAVDEKSGRLITARNATGNLEFRKGGGRGMVMGRVTG